MVSAATKWSLIAGSSTFLCGTVLLGLLGPVTDVLGTLLHLPETGPAVVFALPAALVGTPVWWKAVEQPGVYTYPRGAAFGAGTALGTLVVWLAVFALVWEPALVLTGGILVAFVGVVTVPVGLPVGTCVMYARRQLAERRPAERESASQNQIPEP